MLARIAVLAALLALFLPSALANGANPKLEATVGTGDAFVIRLVDSAGNRVVHLDPGTYDVVVHDQSSIHNFHLIGPGVNMATSVEDPEEITWTVTLADGRYVFRCDPHLTVMRGAFTAGNPPPLPVKLSAFVGPHRTIGMRTATGGKLKTIAAGAVTVTVNDRSKKDNFHLTGPGVNRKTGVASRGRATWNLNLSAGRYTYRSDKTKRLRATFTVTGSA